MTDTFAGLGLAPELVQALTELGYEEPTPIQREAIPPLLAGRDLLGQAATGTGKTAAFALPLLQRLGRVRPVPLKPAVLVLVPTRELAIQVAEAFHRYGQRLDSDVVPIYGGQDFRRQILALQRGAHVVVATPGRVLDHLRRQTIDLSGLAAVVLDEADEMLDMGFAEDLEQILDAAPTERQTALFSATIPRRIAAIAEAHLREPLRIHIPHEVREKGDVPRVRQVAYIVPRAHKVAALGRVLDLESPALALIFCRTRTEVDSLAQTLSGRGFRVEALHGGMSQDQRDRVMRKVRGGTIDLLVATDVAARGIDIEKLSHVVNFDVPASADDYVHRIGRTGRAGRTGVAITLAEPREHRMLRAIEQTTKHRIEVASVPTLLDVRARRLDLTRGAVRDTILAGDLDGYRVVAETLADEFDPMDVAAAAVKLAHEATVGGRDADEAEIPLAAPAPEPGPAKGGARSGARGGAAGAAGAKRRPGKPGAAAARGGSGGMLRVFIGAGRKAGIRPADLVGAIANEAGVSVRDIGAIEIADKFSLVELSEGVVERVATALRATTIKRKKVVVRVERPGPTSG